MTGLWTRNIHYEWLLSLLIVMINDNRHAYCTYHCIKYRRISKWNEPKLGLHWHKLKWLLHYYEPVVNWVLLSALLCFSNIVNICRIPQGYFWHFCIFCIFIQFFSQFLPFFVLFFMLLFLHILYFDIFSTLFFISPLLHLWENFERTLQEHWKNFERTERTLK